MALAQALTNSPILGRAKAFTVICLLVVDPKQEEKLRKLFALRGLTWVYSQTRQAMHPPCGKPVENFFCIQSLDATEAGD